MKDELSTNFIYLIVIVMLLSFWARILGYVELSNVIYAASLAIIMIKYFSDTRINAKILIILALTIISIFDGIANDVELNVDYFLHAGITSCVFMCIDMVGNREIVLNKKTHDNIILIFILSGILLAIYYYFGGLKNVHIEHNDAASLNMGNPNEGGLWMACYIIIYIGSIFALKGFWKIAALSASVFLLPILFATDSRNSLYAAVLFTVMTAVLYILRIKRIPQIILLLVSMVPIVVFFFYMYVIIPNKYQWSLVFDTMEKGIDTREIIWKEILDNMSNCFWIGDYKKYYDGQMHNSMMTLYCRYGVVYLVFAVAIIYQTLKKVQKKLSIYATLSLCGLLFTGCFEGALFVGVAGLYLMFLIVPILLKDTYYREKKKTKSKRHTNGFHY